MQIPEDAEPSPEAWVESGRVEDYIRAVQGEEAWPELSAGRIVAVRPLHWVLD